MKKGLLIENAKEILTMSGDNFGNVSVLENASIYIEDGIIMDFGEKHTLELLLKDKSYDTLDASGKTVLPGFVDSHTHAVFGGSRVLEYTSSITGNREKLEKLGLKSGIYATIDMTNQLPKEEILKQSFHRMKRLHLSGITTIESKSGYSLTTEGEMKLLDINEELEKHLPMDIVSTFLGAHGSPQDMEKSRYMDILTKEMIPKIAEQGTARFCDIWCDDGYYTAKESEEILTKARDYGIESKIHTDAYSYIGGSDLAAEMKMMSADHLNYTPNSVLEKLRDNQVVGVVLPAIEFSVHHPKPVDIRNMINHGMTIALATNCNPGAWITSMQFVLVIACRTYGLSPEEALYAATVGGASALGLHDRGKIKKGMKADLQIWDVDTYEDCIYKFNENPVDMIIKDGVLVAKQGILL